MALQGLRDSIAKMDQHLELRAKTSAEKETIHCKTSSTNEPQCNEMTPGTSDHPDQLPQEQREASNHPSKNQSRGAGSAEPKAALEDTVQTSDADDKLESRIKNVLKMYRRIRTAPDNAAQSAESYRHAEIRR
jgi:hypothetical protein